MATRLELQTLLEKTLGSENVYFQPPESKQISYPAIIYSLGNMESNYADDVCFTSVKQYTVVYVTKDPDSEMIDNLAQLPYCRFDRHYKKDNLNHYVYNLYF
jgi:hypothetical protein